MFSGESKGNIEKKHFNKRLCGLFRSLSGISEHSSHTCSPSYTYLNLINVSSKSFYKCVKKKYAFFQLVGSTLLILHVKQHFFSRKLLFLMKLKAWCYFFMTFLSNVVGWNLRDENWYMQSSDLFSRLKK